MCFRVDASRGFWVWQLVRFLRAVAAAAERPLPGAAAQAGAEVFVEEQRVVASWVLGPENSMWQISNLLACGFGMKELGGFLDPSTPDREQRVSGTCKSSLRQHSFSRRVVSWGPSQKPGNLKLIFPENEAGQPNP